MRLIGKRYDVFSFLGPRLEHQFCGTLKLLFDSRVKPFISVRPGTFSRIQVFIARRS